MAYLTKDDIYNASDGRCYYCGEEVVGQWHAEHMIPKSKGGMWSMDNIVVSCPTCNSKKNNNNVEEFRHIQRYKASQRTENGFSSGLEQLEPYITEQDYAELVRLWRALNEKIETVEINFWGEK